MGMLGVLAGYSNASAIGEPLELVVDSRARATIVLAQNPTAAAQLAAFELQHYLRKIGGVELRIAREPALVEGNRILVGQSIATARLGYRNDTFSEQEYAIKTFPKTLLLMGFDAQEFSDVHYENYGSLYSAASGPIGTCYAVHDFLESVLGVHWYYPNEELGEVVPVFATVTAGVLDIRRRPDAPIRSIYPLFSNTEQLYFTDWDQRKKFYSSYVDSRLSLLYWIRNRFWASKLYNANHSFHGYDDAFGESHPEWFSTKSYERMKQLRYQGAVQPCLTAPGFFEQVVQVARDYFDGKKEAYPGTYRSVSGNFFPVVPNDNTNMCGCSDCRAQYRSDFGPVGNASHYVWGFVNHIAREVGKTHPNAMITGLAYFNYTTPPRGMVFEPNVAVTFCKFYTYYANRNYQDRDYQRISEYVNDNKARFFTTWEYLLKPAMGNWAFPCMVPHVHADDVRRLSEIGGFMGGINQFAYLTTYSGDSPGGIAWANPVLDFMNMYWRMKLYNNFDFDVDEGLEEYYETFFGPGAGGMASFYTAMENRWMDIGGGQESRSWWGKMGTADFMDEVASYIQKARQATEEGTVYRKRVELIDAGIMQYLLKARERYEVSAMAEFAPIGTAASARVSIPAENDWADDATWATSLPNAIEKTIMNESVSHKTIFKLAHDDKYLYIKAKCIEPHVSQMKASTQGKDIGGFSDDSIELFVDPSGRGKTYYQFCINSLGAVYDALENPTAIGATATITWDSGIKIKTNVGADYWELRAALPFTSLVDGIPEPGSTWRFNLCRNRWAEQGKPPYSSWSATLGGFKNPDQFGIITFNGPQQGGRALWNCDFDSSTFASASGESRLIGMDGWYENASYANRGWDKSWKVVERDNNRVAVCDVNATNRSDIVPMHVVQVFPGIVSVEADYRRLAMEGNAPAIFVMDANGKYFAYIYTQTDNDDIVTIGQSGSRDRKHFGQNEHGLAGLCHPGKWFGLKVIIDTEEKSVTGHVRRGDGPWVQLNDTPLPYYSLDAEGTQLFIGFGSRKHKKVENNIVDMDNIRVMQLSHETEKSQSR